MAVEKPATTMAESQKKRSVLITGCSEGGLGFALAQEFHRKGLRVFATARNLAKVQHLRDAGLEIIQVDVVDQTSVRGAVAAVSKLTGGTLDILVNNAGGGYQMPLLDADLDEARKLFEVNVWGLLAVTQAFAPLLEAAAAAGSKARVVNIGSVVSRINVPWQGICAFPDHHDRLFRGNRPLIQKQTTHPRVLWLCSAIL